MLLHDCLAAIMRADAVIALGIFWTAFVEPCSLGSGLTLRLPAAVVVILARDGGEHVEQHGNRSDQTA